MIRQRLLDRLTEAFELRRGDAARLGTGPDFAGFVDLARDLQHIWGRLASMLLYLCSDPAAASLTMLGLLLVSLVPFLLASTTEGAGWEKAASVAAGLLAFWQAAAPARTAIGRVLDSTAGIAAEISQVREDRLKELARAETELRAAEDEAAARTAAAERAAQALARYVEPGRSGANPPRLLRYMLEDDRDARALERELGMTSRPRRLFQALDEIVREKLRSRSDPDVPERIVIYIDDLDRCTPPQAYGVLQAIQLLLAFDLFVVVVGVDVSWVQRRSCRRSRSKTSTSRTSQSFIEKIFQLPYWLRPLEAGSYGRFVRDLIEADLATEATPNRGPETTEIGSSTKSWHDIAHLPVRKRLPKSTRSRLQSAT